MSCCAGQVQDQEEEKEKEKVHREDDERQSQQSGELARQDSIKWQIRPMRHDDIKRCLEIWRQVELTEAHLTVASVLATDPDGFYVAELKSSGEVIGMCSGTMTREDTAFMGFYAVAPDFQGIGIGRQLWAQTMARLERCSHNIGLYGVPSMSDKYKKSGFKLEDSVRMLIYESQPGERLRTSELKSLSELQDEQQQQQQQQQQQDDSGSCSCWRLELISGRTSAMLIKKLIDFDERVNKHSREKLLRTYLTDGAQVPLTVAITRCPRQGASGSPAGQPASCASGNYSGERKSSCCLKPSQEAIKEDEALSTSVKSSLSISAINSVGTELHMRSSSPIDIPSPVSSISSSHQQYLALHSSNYQHHIEFMGYGCIRHDNTEGAMIGPIYARSRDTFEVILRELVDRFDIKPGGKYSAMSLSSNERAGKVLEQIGFEELDQCSRMFTRFVPDASLDQVYLVHSPNFTLF